MGRTAKAIFAVLLVALLAGCAKQSAPIAEPDSPSTTSFATPTPSTTIVYDNKQFGFTFVLPMGWRGYSTVAGTWSGYDGNDNGKIKAKGPILKIRHPLWQAASRREDIPIMVFTTAQWKDLMASKFIVSPAPFPPSELGHNAKYIFALPARYNYDQLPGFQEVDQILQGNPLKGH